MEIYFDYKDSNLSSQKDVKYKQNEIIFFKDIIYDNRIFGKSSTFEELVWVSKSNKSIEESRSSIIFNVDFSKNNLKEKNYNKSFIINSNVLKENNKMFHVKYCPFVLRETNSNKYYKVKTYKDIEHYNDLLNVKLYKINNIRKHKFKILSKDINIRIIDHIRLKKFNRIKEQKFFFVKKTVNKEVNIYKDIANFKIDLNGYLNKTYNLKPKIKNTLLNKTFNLKPENKIIRKNTYYRLKMIKNHEALLNKNFSFKTDLYCKKNKFYLGSKTINNYYCNKRYMFSSKNINDFYVGKYINLRDFSVNAKVNKFYFGNSNNKSFKIIDDVFCNKDLNKVIINESFNTSGGRKKVNIFDYTNTFTPSRYKTNIFEYEFLHKDRESFKIFEFTKAHKSKEKIDIFNQLFLGKSRTSIKPHIQLINLKYNNKSIKSYDLISLYKNKMKFRTSTFSRLAKTSNEFNKNNDQESLLARRFKFDLFDENIKLKTIKRHYNYSNKNIDILKKRYFGERNNNKFVKKNSTSLVINNTTIFSEMKNKNFEIINKLINMRDIPKNIEDYVPIIMCNKINKNADIFYNTYYFNNSSFDFNIKDYSAKGQRYSKNFNILDNSRKADIKLKNFFTNYYNISANKYKKNTQLNYTYYFLNKNNKKYKTTNKTFLKKNKKSIDFNNEPINISNINIKTNYFKEEYNLKTNAKNYKTLNNITISNIFKRVLPNSEFTWFSKLNTDVKTGLESKQFFKSKNNYFYEYGKHFFKRINTNNYNIQDSVKAKIVKTAGYEESISAKLKDKDCGNISEILFIDKKENLTKYFNELNLNKNNKDICLEEHFYFDKNFVETYYDDLKLWISDKGAKEVYMDLCGHVGTYSDSFGDQLKFLSGSVDELLLPQIDFDYSSFTKDIVNENGQPLKPIKIIDDRTFVSKYPTEMPVLPTKLGIEYIDVPVNVLVHILEVFYNIWHKKIFEFGNMDMKMATNRMLEYIASYMNLTMPEVNKKQCARIYRLIRWYCETAVINNSTYLITSHYKELDADIYSGNIKFKNSTPNMFINGLGALTNKVTGENCYVEFYLDNPVDTEFEVFIGVVKGICNIYINDEIVDTFKNTNVKNTYDIEKGKNIIKIELNCYDNSNGNIYITKFTVKELVFTHTTTEYRPQIGSGNRILDEVIKRASSVAQVLPNTQEYIQNCINGNMALTFTIEKLYEYFELHHSKKSKGKRLTIKK